jgi:hypothetical protein
MTLHFLDSGAFSQMKDAERYREQHGGGWWAFYHTKDFRRYVEDYAEFIQKYKLAIDYYANLDVIYNPELTWQSQKYLEHKHHLSPVPVVHYGTSLRWLAKYIDAGYEYIGLGGKPVNGTSSFHYKQWLDQAFDIVASKSRLVPAVKIHGFGVSSIELWLQYPYYSVDSTSIYKKSGYGWILVPRKRRGAFVLTEPPIHVNMSEVRESHRHYDNLGPLYKRAIREWLDSINVPLGSAKTKGVANDFSMRRIALFHYYRCAAQALPNKMTVFHAGTTSLSDFEKQHCGEMGVMTSFYKCRRKMKPERVVQELYDERKLKNRLQPATKRDPRKYAS